MKARSQYFRGTQGEGLTPNVDALLEQGVNWDYFIKEKATEDNCSSQNLDEGDILYSIGPRSGSSRTRQIIVIITGLVIYKIVSYRIVSTKHSHLLLLCFYLFLLLFLQQLRLVEDKLLSSVLRFSVKHPTRRCYEKLRKISRMEKK